MVAGRTLGSKPSLSVRLPILGNEVWSDIRGRDSHIQRDRTHLDAAIRWLYRSQDATGTGGCASNYNLVLGWGGPYPETTGYIVPTLYEYADRYGSLEARRRADQMAEWLCETQFETGAFPKGDNPQSEREPSVFNTGQILFGLARAYEVTDEQAYLDAAEQAGEWLVSVQHPDGYWDRYDYNDVVHSYSSRIAWGLLAANEHVGSPTVRSTAMRNLRWVADQQREDGWFRRAGFDRGDDPFLHTIAYTIRGLLEGAVILDDDELLDAAIRSAAAFLEIQQRTGILTGRFDSSFQGSNFYCLTGNAQMAIIWYRLFDITGVPRYRTEADRTVRFLKQRQPLTGPSVLRGGLSGSAPVWGPYMYLRYPNWAAKFLADALFHAAEADTAAST